MEPIVQDVLRDGFVKVGSVWSPGDLETLRRVTDEMLAQERRPFSEFLTLEHDSSRYQNGAAFGNVDWTLVIDAAGRWPEFDRITEATLTHPTIRGALESILGPGYKLHQLNVRRAEGGSVGQDLHQDPSEIVGMTILLSDVARGDGATVFMPRSHRWPIKYSDLGVPMQVRRLHPILASAHGRAGDGFCFFHRTWHGRMPSSVARATAIFMGFVGVGYPMRLRPMAPAILDSVGPELRRLLDHSGLRPTDATTAEVVWTGNGAFPGRARGLDEVMSGNPPYSAVSIWPFLKSWARAKDAVRNSPIGPLARSVIQRLSSA